MQKIISRKEAKALGLMFYFTGKPCPHGHITERYTSENTCKGCLYVEMARKRERTKIRQASRPLSVRQIAQRDGQPRYRTNKPCPRGHYADRYTLNGTCLQCLDEDRKARELRLDPVAERARKTKYRKAEMDRFRTYTRNRRAKIKGASGKHTKEDVTALLKAQNNCCVYGHSLKEGWHVDHRKAISKGGTNDRRNLQILCFRCNVRKHNKDEIDFSRGLGLLL